MSSSRSSYPWVLCKALLNFHLSKDDGDQGELSSLGSKPFRKKLKAASMGLYVTSVLAFQGRWVK